MNPCNTPFLNGAIMDAKPRVSATSGEFAVIDFVFFAINRENAVCRGHAEFSGMPRPG